ncbi:MAG: cupin domain-containing protein [Rhodospirillales bacterium]
MNVSRITRMEPGPDGFEVWEQIPDSALIRGKPTQRGRMVWDDKDTGLQVGAWDCTTMTTVMEPYSVHEFMHILEGAVTIVHEDGSELTVEAGERFVIPKGTVCSWKQQGYIRKYFVIFDDPSGAKAENPSTLRAFKLDPHAELSPSPVVGGSFRGGVPNQAERVFFEDPTGQLSVGLWMSTPFEREPAAFDRCELMLPVEGEMTLIGNGREQTFRPGDAAFVPEGADYCWKSEETVAKIYVIFKAKD